MSAAVGQGMERGYGWLFPLFHVRAAQSLLKIGQQSTFSPASMIYSWILLHTLVDIRSCLKKITKQGAGRYIVLQISTELKI